LLEAFGEPSGRCGQCDNCRGGVFSLPRRAGLVGLRLRIAALTRFARAETATPDAEPSAAEPAPALPVFERPVEDAPLRVTDDPLFRALQRLRLDIARRRGLPPRRIASDALLRRLAAARPRSLDAPCFDGAEIVEAESFLRLIRSHEETGAAPERR
jgi:ATP-dependent DNA helicase RecQ